ncbi:MAG TPA: hypothetical protein H9671_09555 [Firmicutes bacterium]|nr:hypothetical protein [Bacillota bacterium]
MAEKSGNKTEPTSQNTEQAKKSRPKPGGVHHAHRQRVKQRFHEQGLDAFPAHNKMEMLLFFGIPQGDTNEIAHRLLQEFGSISGVLDAPYEELLKIKGIGENAATLLKLIPAISRAYMVDLAHRNQVLDTSAKVITYISPLFIGEQDEQCYLICLNSGMQVLRCEKIASGSFHQVSADLLRIISIITKCRATHCILTHNHPSALALPSSSDLSATAALQKGLATVGVTLVDHVIADRTGDCCSLREIGALQQPHGF